MPAEKKKQRNWNAPIGAAINFHQENGVLDFKNNSIFASHIGWCANVQNIKEDE